MRHTVNNKFTRAQVKLTRACALVGPGVATPLLQSYTILIGVVGESFMTVWCGMWWQLPDGYGNITLSIKPLLSWSVMMLLYVCKRSDDCASLYTRVCPFCMYYGLLVKGVTYLPWQSSSIRDIRLASNTGVKVRLKKCFITITVNYRWYTCWFISPKSP